MIDFNNLNKEERDYFFYHEQRFTYLVNKVEELINNLNQNQKVRLLDIGPHFQTSLLKKRFGDKIIINTLGWEITQTIVPKRIVNVHYNFDLNDTAHKSKWIQCEKHDIVLMAEVFEHLYTSPEYFLSFLKSTLRCGGILLIGTPNGVALSKRVGILKGRNPFEKIRTTIHNPGHFREYTIEELIEYGIKLKFHIQDYELRDFHKQRLLTSVVKNIFPRLRDCIHITLINDCTDNHSI